MCVSKAAEDPRDVLFEEVRRVICVAFHAKLPSTAAVKRVASRRVHVADLFKQRVPLKKKENESACGSLALHMRVEREAKKNSVAESPRQRAAAACAADAERR